MRPGRKQIVVFFNIKGLIYTNYVPRGTRVNTNYIVDALGKFLKIFKGRGQRWQLETGGFTEIMLRCIPLPW